MDTMMKKWEVAERDKKVVRTANLLRVMSLSMIQTSYKSCSKSS
jgi:hypothetical protein